MSCHNPIYGFRALTPNEKTGKFPVLFAGATNKEEYMPLPCGKCNGCLQDRSISWGIRCIHESTFHEECSFITLTYDDKHIPDNGMLRPDHLTNFWKSLRKTLPDPIKYFACGEYGSRTFRAHYHAIIFGYRPKDLVLWKTTPEGYPLYQSADLLQIWQKGMCVIGNVNFATCQYVAKYITKKNDIKRMFKDNDQFIPPFIRVSQKLGIRYLIRHWEEIYRWDQCIMDGNRYKPPRAYDKWLEENQLAKFQQVKAIRRYKSLEKEQIDKAEKDRRGIAAELKSNPKERDETESQ